jgi:hypothetical protein
MVALLNGAGCEHASPASGTVASLVELATARSCASSWSRSPSPNGGWVPARRPRPRRSIAWSRQTTTVKNDASCSRRPVAATRNMARAIPPSVCRSSGWSVRLPAKLTVASVTVCPFLLPGRAVCPALGPGGRWTPWHAPRPPGQATEPTKSATTGSTAGPWVGSGAGLVGGALAAGVGHASTVRPDPSTLALLPVKAQRRSSRATPTGCARRTIVMGRLATPLA